MPIFQPRTRVEIIREMVARVVARSRLVGLTRNSAVFHILAAAANEDAELYFQMTRLRDLFSIDRATGSDLDERAAEIQPAFVVRRQALAAFGEVTFSRPGIIGVVAIPIGSIVAAQDSEGQVKFRTTAAGSILAGFTTSAPVSVVAVAGGSRGNVAAGAIVQFVTRIAGVTGVTNALSFNNGRDRESDANFRARLKAFVQSITRGTVTALEGFAKNVILADGRRVLFAHVREPVIPNGQVELFIDDGTGSVEEFSSDFIGADDTLVAAALGGETQFFTAQKPIRDDGSFSLEINAIVQTRNVDYVLNPANGQINLDPGVYPVGLTAGDVVTANYRYYTGLIQETQRVIDGDPTTPLTRPGVRAAGILVFVLPPQTVLQSIDAAISVQSGFDTTVVGNQVRSALQDYINSLDIGEDVIVAELIERAMGVTGMFNFKLNDLTGSSPAADQIILDNQVARIIDASITLT